MKKMIRRKIEVEFYPSEALFFVALMLLGLTLGFFQWHILGICLFCLGLLYVALWIHELGHLFTALMLKMKVFSIYVSAGPLFFPNTFSINSRVGIKRDMDEVLYTRKKRIVLLAGPFAVFAVAILLILFVPDNHNTYSTMNIIDIVRAWSQGLINQEMLDWTEWTKRVKDFFLVISIAQCVPIKGSDLLTFISLLYQSPQNPEKIIKSPPKDLPIYILLLMFFLSYLIGSVALALLLILKIRDITPYY